MNLKTHTAYNETVIDQTSWSVRIYDVFGKVLEQSSGKANNQEEARKAASAFVSSVETKYRKD